MGLKEPQAPLLEQVTDQVTPLFWLSFVTVAVRLAVAPAAMEVGAAGLKATEIGGAVMLIVADMDAAVPEDVVAVMVTLWTVEGAV